MTTIAFTRQESNTKCTPRGHVTCLSHGFLTHRSKVNDLVLSHWNVGLSVISTQMLLSYKYPYVKNINIKAPKLCTDDVYKNTVIRNNYVDDRL